MKKLIVYTSKTGTVEKCVNKLKEKIENIDIVNIEEEQVNITDYDIIIIGTPIRMSLFNKKIKCFIEKNKEELLTKKVAYFICCGFNENIKQYYNQNISKELLDKAIIYTSFGGEMDINKQKGFDKFVVKMVSKKEGNKDIKILDDNINQFIKVINNLK